jgi:hypothetical protein
MNNTGKMVLVIIVGLLILLWGIIWIILKYRDTVALVNAAAVSNILCEGKDLTENDIKEKYADDKFKKTIETVVSNSGAVSNWWYYLLAGIQILLGIIIIVWGIFTFRGTKTPTVVAQ